MVEYWQSVKDPDKVLGLFIPDKITQKLIEQHTETFLNEMINWKNARKLNPIGFNQD